MSTSIASIATTAHPLTTKTLPQTLPTIAKLVRIRRNGHDADAYPLTGSMNIGSGASCTLRINVDSISPDHAEIIFDDDDKAWITNKSTYGTFVNAADIGVHQGYPLEQGDVITVGDKRFRFEYLHENMDMTTVTPAYCYRMLMRVVLGCSNDAQIKDKRIYRTSDNATSAYRF